MEENVRKKDGNGGEDEEEGWKWERIGRRKMQ